MPRSAPTNTPLLLLGDCTDALPKIGIGTADLIVTSPPYPNMRMDYGDSFTEAEYGAFTRAWLKEAVRVLTDNGSIWVNVGWMGAREGCRVPLPYLLWPVCRELGLHLQQEIVWQKPNRPSPSNLRFTTRTERWMWLTKAPRGHTFNLDAVRLPLGANQGTDKRNNPKGANPTDVWEFTPVNGNANDRPDHPCPFPLPMIERVVLACSNPGDLVLDPFMGSGTTGVAALLHRRRFVGIEQVPQYLHVASQRLHKVERDLWEAERRTLNSKIIDLESAIAEATAAKQIKASQSNRDRILKLLADGHPRSVADAFKEFGGAYVATKCGTKATGGQMSVGTVKNVLRTLSRERLVTSSGSGKRHDPVRYQLRSIAFTFIDLFAGVGGMRLGLEAAGGQCVFSSEIDPAAARTYEANFAERPRGDIRGIQPDDIPDHDVLAAGLPCQPWSIAGDRQGFADPRGALFFTVAEIIRVKRPRVVLLENVKGLTTGGKNSGVAKITETLEGLGYRVQWKVLNALDFGLPQTRERVIILAFRDDVQVAWPKPSGQRANLADFLDPDADADAALQPSPKTLKKAAVRAEANAKPSISPSVWHTNMSGNVSVLPYSVALRANASADYILVNGQRRPSARELLSWQGFPPNFRVTGSYGVVRRHIGNAVPVPMIVEVAEAMITALASTRAKAA